MFYMWLFESTTCTYPAHPTPRRLLIVIELYKYLLTEYVNFVNAVNRTTLR